MVKDPIRILLLLGVFLASQLIYCQTELFKPVSDKEIICNKIIAKAKQTSTVHSSFQQTKYLDYLSASIESRGDFFFKKENLLRWEYTEPYQYTIVLNNGKMSFKSDDKENELKVRKNELFEILNNILHTTLLGELIMSKQFDVSFSENNIQVLMTLIPKSQTVKKLVPKISVYFDKSTYYLSRIIIFETNGDYTNIAFINNRFNHPIPVNLFNLN